MNVMLKDRVLETRSMPSDLEHKNNLVQEMESIISKAKTERRNLTTSEQNRFNSVKKEVEALTEKLTSGSAESYEVRAKKAGEQVKSPMEVRGYKKGENIGNGNDDVSVGDLIYSHVTGRYKNSEVRAGLSTTSGGLSVPTEVFGNFIDRLRHQWFLNETTVYPMNTKSLLIPRVTSDPAMAFKLENDLILEDQPLFAPVTLNAKPLYAMTSISLELIEASNLDMGEVITKILIGSVQQFMQNSLISGAANGYLGIVNDTGINKPTATAPVDYSEIGAAIQAIRANNGEPNAIIAHSNTLMNLELLTDSTGQFVQPPAFYQNINKYALGNGTSLVNDVIVADLSSIAWGILSEGGLQIDIDKSGEAFQRGQIKVRARFNGDFALTNPKLVSLVDVV